MEMWAKLGDAGYTLIPYTIKGVWPPMLTTLVVRFLGITAAEEYGGIAMGYQSHCIVMEELSRASGTSPFTDILIISSIATTTYVT